MNPNAANPIIVTPADFPLCCPPKNNEVWDMHPRVYLTMAENGEVVCPYCSAKYILKQESKK